MLLNISTDLSEVLSCQDPIVYSDFTLELSTRTHSQPLGKDIKQCCFTRTTRSHYCKYFLRFGESIQIEQYLLHIRLIFNKRCLHASRLWTWLLIWSCFRHIEMEAMPCQEPSVVSLVECSCCCHSLFFKLGRFVLCLLILMVILDIGFCWHIAIDSEVVTSFVWTVVKACGRLH